MNTNSYRDLLLFLLPLHEMAAQALVDKHGDVHREAMRRIEEALASPTPEHGEAKLLREAVTHLRCLVMCLERDRDHPGPSILVSTDVALGHCRDFLDGTTATSRPAAEQQK